MFGILWGIIAVVVLSATGEGFQRGNQAVLEELGKNIAIVWGGRTSMQAGGERAGRRVFLTVDDARAIEREAPLVAVVSAEINRGLRIKSRFNAASLSVHGIEPQYQAIRTIDIEQRARLRRPGRRAGAARRHHRRRRLGAAVRRTSPGWTRRSQLNGVPYTVIGKIRKKNQDSNYSGPDNDKVFVPFAAMARDFPRTDAPPGTVSQIIVAPKPFVVADLPRVLDARTGRIEDVDWPLERDVRRGAGTAQGLRSGRPRRHLACGTPRSRP